MSFLTLKKKYSDVVLILTPPWGIEYPPLQIIKLASFLRKNSISVKVFDMNIEFYATQSKNMKKLWERSEFHYWYKSKESNKIMKEWKIFSNKYINKIKKYNPLLCCFSINSGNIITTKILLKELKNRYYCVLGGPAVIDEVLREKFLDNLILIKDNNKILELINLIRKEKKRYNFLINHEKDFNLSLYETNTVPFILSSGCVQKCLFCNDISIQKKFCLRSPTEVFNEIKKYYYNYNFKQFESHDLLINGNLNFLEKFTDLIINSGMKIEWNAQAIIRNMSSKLLYKMKKSGLNSLLFGLETASDRILKSMNKNHTSNLASKIIKKTSKVGIDVYLNLIVGLPGEDEDSLYKTIGFIKEHKLIIKGISSLNTCVVIKNTLLYKLRKEFGIFIKDEKEYYNYDWYDTKGNTFERRKEWFEIMNNFLVEEKIKVDETNLYWQSKLENIL